MVYSKDLWLRVASRMLQGGNLSGPLALPASSGGIIAVHLLFSQDITIPCAVKVPLLLWPVREHQNINTRLYQSIHIASYRD